jgi:MFS family permease
MRPEMHPDSLERVRGLRTVAASFIWLGLFWGGWAVAALDVERSLGLNHAAFGLLLTGATGAAVVANFLAGPLAERWGSALGLGGSLGLFGLLLLVLALTGQPAAFMALFVFAVALSGSTDVMMNVAAAAALGSRPGQFARFHGLFNGGAAAGAALMGGLLALGASWRWAWALQGLAAIVLAAITARASLPAGGGGERVSARVMLSTLRRERLLGLAVVLAAATMVEGGIDTWGVLFLRSQLAITAGLGAAAYVVGQGMATLSRVAFGPRVGVMAVGVGASTGAAVAAAGLTLEAVAPSGVVAALGLATAVVGISLCWPLLVAAGAAGNARPGLTVGALTGTGYVGFLIGPSLVGWAAGAWGLRVGILILVAAALLPAFGARQASRRRS